MTMARTQKVSDLIDLIVTHKFVTS